VLVLSPDLFQRDLDLFILAAEISGRLQIMLSQIHYDMIETVTYEPHSAAVKLSQSPVEVHDPIW
jgi:hypothetical protein